ncbi:MAG: hypothetical protein AABX16_04880 [Nanoarchaeota archaeon]
MKLVIKEVEQIPVAYKIILCILLGILILGIYFFGFYTKPCSDFICFQESLRYCKKTEFVKDDTEGIWRYKILGNAQKKDACNIQVTLLALKKGTIDLEQLQNKKMTCIMMKSSTLFPDEDLQSCTGVLKEEIQEVMIQRMHNYLLKNLGQIQDELKKI